jgi:hypothetical protein
MRPDNFKGRTALKRQTKSQMAFGAKLVANLLEKKVLKNVPPLKDFPSEEVSSESYHSDRTDKIMAKSKLDQEIKNFRETFAPFSN